jgi:hypothetical protein
LSRFPIGGYNVHSVGSFREPGQDNGLVFARSLKYILGGSAIG